MTMDNVIVFDLQDISTVQFECGECHARYVTRVAEWKKLPTHCVNCNIELVVNQSLEHDALRQLQHSIQQLLKSKNPKLKVRFEINTASTATAT